ncbi:DUF6530 family protein [Sphingomonas sp. GB1N7]|uniref:DUF6530 family protein n=1 Tax=Parasphingomonas caseinilytica TaxID=3096158 RepID=UPI002FCB6EFC
MPQETNFPDHIAHKPVYVVPYYGLDPLRPSNTDAQFITLGWSQWDGDELSAKVVRHSGKRWSRQSEELPLPRVIDLAILTALAFGEDDGLVQIEAGTFEHQTVPIKVVHGSKRDRMTATQALRNDNIMRSRLRALFDTLKPIHDRGLL